MRRYSGGGRSPHGLPAKRHRENRRHTCYLPNDINRRLWLRAPFQHRCGRKRQQLKGQEIAVMVRLFKPQTLLMGKAFLRILVAGKLMNKLFRRSAKKQQQGQPAGKQHISCMLPHAGMGYFIQRSAKIACLSFLYVLEFEIWLFEPGIELLPQPSLSKIPAMPCPPPMQAVTMPYFLSSRCRSCRF